MALTSFRVSGLEVYINDTNASGKTVYFSRDYNASLSPRFILSLPDGYAIVCDHLPSNLYNPTLAFLSRKVAALDAFTFGGLAYLDLHGLVVRVQQSDLVRVVALIQDDGFFLQVALTATVTFLQ